MTADLTPAQRGAQTRARREAERQRAADDAWDWLMVLRFIESARGGLAWDDLYATLRQDAPADKRTREYREWRRSIHGLARVWAELLDAGLIHRLPGSPVGGEAWITDSGRRYLAEMDALSQPAETP